MILAAHLVHHHVASERQLTVTGSITPLGLTLIKVSPHGVHQSSHAQVGSDEFIPLEN